MEVLLILSLVYGITFTLKDSKLLARPRNYLAERYQLFLTLFSCAYCVGFHSGWISFLLTCEFPVSLFEFVRSFLVYGFAGSAISGVVDTLLLRLEKGLE